MRLVQDFESFVQARWTRLVRTAVLLGCPPADAEDMVQTALTKTYVHWRKVSRADNPDAYVHRILVNTFLSSRRRKWHGEQPTEELPEHGTPDRTAGVDLADAVAHSLARLSPEQRQVVVLRHFAQLSEAETAHVLKVPAGTVKSRLARALKALAADPQMMELEGIA